MTPKQAADAVKRKLAELEKFRRTDVPEIVGTEAVRHYRKSFDNEGATDETLKKWPDVKRRDPNSPWYGFSLGSNSPRPLKPGAHVKAKKKTGTAKTNFSPTRAADKVLTGETNDLRNAIKYTVKPDRVTVSNSLPYARVHNFGEKAMIFGRKAFTMKARPFIYPSAVLKKIIYDKIAAEMKKRGLTK